MILKMATQIVAELNVSSHVNMPTKLERERERQTETERERNRETERQRERDREKEGRRDIQRTLQYMHILYFNIIIMHTCTCERSVNRNSLLS